MPFSAGSGLFPPTPFWPRQKKCSDRIVKLYAEPNRKMDELFTTLHGGELEVFKRFSDACRVEIRKYSAYLDCIKKARGQSRSHQLLRMVSKNL